MLFFLRFYTFGQCTGISFADSTMIPVYHNLMRYANKVFKDIAIDEKDSNMKYGLKVCDERGKITIFYLAGTNVDGRDSKV